MSYNELKHELETCPKTWVPAFLAILVRSAYLRGGIFVDGGASAIAQHVENEVGHPKKDQKSE